MNINPPDINQEEIQDDSSHLAFLPADHVKIETYFFIFKRICHCEDHNFTFKINYLNFF